MIIRAICKEGQPQLLKLIIFKLALNIYLKLKNIEKVLWGWFCCRDVVLNGVICALFYSEGVFWEMFKERVCLIYV